MLSRSEQRPVKANPSLRDYIAAYVLWFLTIAVSLLVALAIRDLYQMAMVLTTWHRYTVHAVNQFATLGLILLLVGVVVAVEGYYRHGVQKGQLTYRFWRVLAVLSAVLAVTQGLRLVLEAIASSVNLISVLIFAVVSVQRGDLVGRRSALHPGGPRLWPSSARAG